MKAIFKSDDPKEIKALAKAQDMALFIWELKHNAWREFKHTDYEYEKAWDKINDLLDKYNINPDDLTE